MALPALSLEEGLSGAERLADWLRERYGMQFEGGKLRMLMQRMQRVMETHGVASFDALADRTQSGAHLALSEAVVNAAATHHTYFLREEATLAFFRDAILLTRGERETRVWSAAASTGDEAYSCAILASETLGRDMARRSVALLGTDISARVIEQAETGDYVKSHLESVDLDLLQRYFVRHDGERWRVAADIRAMCLFRRLNLMAAPYPFRQRFHAVFCRNVLYYFDLDAQRAVVEAIYEVTEPGGYLLVSATDNLRALRTRWAPVHSGVYRRLA